MKTTLIIPGLYSSGPTHWQTWFEEQIPGTVHVIQSDWTKPDLPDWSRRVGRDLLKNPGRKSEAMAVRHGAVRLQLPASSRFGAG